MQTNRQPLQTSETKLPACQTGKAGSDFPEIVQHYKNRLNHDSNDYGITMIKNNNENEIAEKGNHGNQENQTNHGSDRSLKYFMVHKKEIVKNSSDLNLSTYKEEVYEEVSYEKPEMILKKLPEIEKSINNGINKLTEMT